MSLEGGLWGFEWERPWEAYSWERVGSAIRSLPGRLGFDEGDRLKFFGFSVDLSTGAIRDDVLGRLLSKAESLELYFVLYLYSRTSRDAGESGELVPLDKGLCPFVHEPALKKCISVATELFGSKPELLYRAAKPFNYEKVELGDAAIRVRVLPRVPITIAVWCGEECMPPSIQILFDRNAPCYLAEDVSAACEASQILALLLLSRLLLNLAKELGADIASVEYDQACFLQLPTVKLQQL